MISYDPQKSAYEQGCKDTIKAIASDLERMSNDYIPLPVGVEPWDVWEFSAWLAKLVRDGKLPMPASTEPPF